MSPQEIYDDYLLLDKPITLVFPSKAAMLSIKNQLHNVRRASRLVSIELGMGDPEPAGTILEAKVLSKDPVYKVRFSLTIPKPRHTYTILDSPEDSNDAPS